MKLKFSYFKLVLSIFVIALFFVFVYQANKRNLESEDDLHYSRPMWIFNDSVDAKSRLITKITPDLFSEEAKWRLSVSRTPPISRSEAKAISKMALNDENFLKGGFKDVLINETRCSMELYFLSRSEQVHFWLVRIEFADSTDFECVSLAVLMDGTVLEPIFEQTVNH